MMGAAFEAKKEIQAYTARVTLWTKREDERRGFRLLLLQRF